MKSLLNLLTNSGGDKLRQQVQFLKAQNDILRAKLPKRIKVTSMERQRLLRFGKPLGTAVRDLISIVSARTFSRWLKPSPAAKSSTAKVGRPRTDEQLTSLVLRLASETSWGYSRILGELKKLGFGKISRTTVRNILREHGLETGPERGQSTWQKFIRSHAETLRACDFFTKKVWTLLGLKTFCVLISIHIASRRIHLGGFTTNPDASWMGNQAKELSRHFAGLPVKPTHLIRDRDGKFVPQFDAILKEQGVEVMKTAPRTPNMNAHCERAILSIKSEMLDHFWVFSEDHLRYLLSEYLSHYHEERTHQGLDNKLLSEKAAKPAAPESDSTVLCKERLRGLLKHYHHQAA